ncbi:MAG: hypothetical protein HC886_04450 [Leptolyngbyaceae cyanobacterium SM1_1_3]|nr:hypothetical protein [Leptolyngbyaceae cyanobacterium SM1_1_3]NJN02171.1 hypothetical protein [Leptolyngbyaceae cyanobacterium RM1_1_2]NJO08949.1 hypothetical protein [Leptolyngbyaceae cyanobacterium SL_1_1]
MGLIKKIFGGVGAFFGSLFGVLGKVFGINKSGYFLELDEESEAKLQPAIAQRPSAAPQQAAPKQPKVEPTALSAKGVEIFPAAAEVATKAALKADQTELEPAKLEKMSKESASTSQDLANLGALPLAAAEAKQPSPGAEMTFAPDYLSRSTASEGRRRPGPSLSPFKQMAKTVRTSAG